MKVKKSPIIIFIIIIAIISFLFQWVYDIMSSADNEGLFMQFLLDLPFVIIMAFVSFLIVHFSNKHFKYRDNIYIRVVFELLLATIFAFPYSFAINYVLNAIVPNDQSPAYTGAAIILILANLLIIMLLELFFYNQRQLRAEKRIAIIEKEKIEYRYSTLKTQMNPHFLFNSLNVLSSLIYEDQNRANIYTKKLSNIYRYFLSSNVQKSVLVKDEISFVESYFFLLLNRFENALTFNINGDPEIQRQVIPVSIQLLIENAIKHNVVISTTPLHIDINIMKDYIEVVNKLQPRLNVEKSGYGLDMLSKQYALFDKTIEVIKTADLFIVKIPYV